MYVADDQSVISPSAAPYLTSCTSEGTDILFLITPTGFMGGLWTPPGVSTTPPVAFWVRKAPSTTAAAGEEEQR